MISMQNKVNIAGMKDGIAALKRGKAFMNLIHKAKHLPEVSFKCKLDALFLWLALFNSTKSVLDFRSVET